MIDVTSGEPDEVAEVFARQGERPQSTAERGDPRLESASEREGHAHRLLRTGHYAEALEECRRVREVWDEVLPDVPGALLSRRLLIWALQELERFDEAEDERRQLVSECSRIYGPNSRDALAARLGLVTLVQRAGRPAEALQQCTELRSACLRELGPDHVVTVGVIARCAELHAVVTGRSGDGGGSAAQ